MIGKLAIWGASGHAKVVADIIRLRAEYELVGFLDSLNPERRGMAFFGAQILGGEEQLDLLLDRGISYLILGFGDCAARLKLANMVTKKGFLLASAVHPKATIAPDTQIQPGSVIAAGAVINPACVVGENVIINTAATVDHDCYLSDGVHICPGAHLAGNVQVGFGAWVGIGACVINRVSIGNGAYIGAGAVVVGDIPANVIAYGNPAKVRRKTV
jgi:sugar O-acyltransferase (sialic acid O-acetyltransferase NeuD family)